MIEKPNRVGVGAGRASRFAFWRAWPGVKSSPPYRNVGLDGFDGSVSKDRQYVGNRRVNHRDDEVSTSGACSGNGSSPRYFTHSSRDKPRLNRGFSWRARSSGSTIHNRNAPSGPPAARSFASGLNARRITGSLCEKFATSLPAVVHTEMPPLASPAAKSPLLAPNVMAVSSAFIEHVKTSRITATSQTLRNWPP